MTQVTDGVKVFKNYYWNENKEIVSKLTNKVLQGDRSQKYCNYCLYEEDGKYKRERTVLLKASFPQMFQPAHKELYMDVFGLEDKYCFLISNPNIVWSKARRSFVKLMKTTSGHLWFNVKTHGMKKMEYIHKMVWESYNQEKYNGKKYNLHHISFNKQQNQIQNIMLISAKDHRSFHNLCQMYEGKKRFAWGNEYSKELQIKKFIEIINTYKLSVQDKSRLINSLNLLKI